MVGERFSGEEFLQQFIACGGYGLGKPVMKFEDNLSFLLIDDVIDTIGTIEFSGLHVRNVDEAVKV